MGWDRMGWDGMDIYGVAVTGGGAIQFDTILQSSLYRLHTVNPGSKIQNPWSRVLVFSLLFCCVCCLSLLSLCYLDSSSIGMSRDLLI